MSRHYSARSFFRQIPNDLLARHCESRGLGSALDFAAWTPPWNAKREAVNGVFEKTAAGPVEAMGGLCPSKEVWKTPAGRRRECIRRYGVFHTSGRIHGPIYSQGSESSPLPWAR